ncbi:MAG: sigma-70 family RNA polymerase sigma factor [Chloroflexota bacterium]
MSSEIAEKQSQYTDEQLLKLVANRDMAAYEALYDRHSTTIYSLILRIVRASSIAEELLQDVFWQIWRDAGHFDGKGAATAWMFRIGRNRSLDQLRRQKARPETDEQSSVEDAHRVSGAEQPSAESEAEVQLNREQVVGALNELPPEQKSCVELAYFEGLSHREIAERLDIPPGTVKSRLRIGLEKLERTLRKAGYP